ncbi:MAG: beta-ketoacyl-[acyl-carrier-protein] synthase family protein [Pirellulales bacterium]|jgi:3-oxoacyl-[acyl-carrier-protein] synthase II
MIETPSSQYETRAPVAITGMGMVTPLGNDFATVSDALMAGHSGVREIDLADASRPQKQFAAPVSVIPEEAGLSPAELGNGEKAEMHRLEQLCGSATARALRSANGVQASAPRIGMVLGLGAEQLKTWEADFLADGQGVFQGGRMPCIATRLGTQLGLTGPCITVAAACASSGYALAVAHRWLSLGLVDACLAGGGDVISPVALAAFYNLRALSRRIDDPTKASRPFDRQRDGFVMGEGAAIFMLEPETAARRRSARVYGLLAGAGMTSDATHMVAPCAEPAQATRAIEMALADAGVEPHEIDYVNAHAPGTPVGDAAEATAIRRALGDSADAVPVSSTKSMSGHLVSGASAFEAVACLAAFERQMIPPTINLDDPDEACALNHVAHQARPATVRTALSNSFGFGGSNLCLVLKAA